MSWGPEAQQKVFDYYRQGSPEKMMVKLLKEEFGVDDKTVRRCLAGLDLIGQLTENEDGLKDRFERLGGTDHYLLDLRRAYAAYQFRHVEDQSSGSNNDHREILIPPLIDLLGICPLELHDLDLATFYSRPTEPSWPISKGRVWRESNGGLVVHLYAEAKLEWDYLRQHLAGDQIWPAIEQWKVAMIMDISSRMALLDAVIRQIEHTPESGGLGWPVILETGSRFVRNAETQSPAVSLYYAFRLYDQALSRFLGLPHGRYEKNHLIMVNEYQTELGDHPVAVAPKPGQCQNASNYFLKAQQEFKSLPQVKTAGEAYRNAEATTRDVKGHVNRLRLAAGFPAGIVCDGCRNQANAIGKDTLSDS